MSHADDTKTKEAIERSARQWFLIDAVLYFSGLSATKKLAVVSHLRSANSDSDLSWQTMGWHARAMDMQKRGANKVMEQLRDEQIIEVIQERSGKTPFSRINPEWLAGVERAFQVFNEEKKVRKLQPPGPLSSRTPCPTGHPCPPGHPTPVPQDIPPLSPRTSISIEVSSEASSHGDFVAKGVAKRNAPLRGEHMDPPVVPPAAGSRAGSDIASEAFTVAMPPEGYRHPFFMTERDEIVLCPGTEPAKVWRELLDKYPEAVVREAMIAAAPEYLKGVRKLSDRHNKGRLLLALIRAKADIKLKYHKQHNGARPAIGGSIGSRFED